MSATMEQSRAPSMRMIKEAVADEFGVTVMDLESARRGRQIARPRQVAMWLARHLTRLSYPQIAALLGGRDHTTVLHGVKKIERLIDLDPAIASRATLLKEALSVDCPVVPVFFVAWTQADGLRAFSDKPRTLTDARAVALRFSAEFAGEPHIVLSQDQLPAWLAGEYVEGVGP